MRGFEYIVSADALEIFRFQTLRQRQLLADAFDKIAASPFDDSDGQRRDAKGRDYSVRRFGKWKITFWIDVPVWEVRIVEITRP